MGVQKAAVIQAHVECRVVRNPGGWVHAYRGGANSHDTTGFYSFCQLNVTNRILFNTKSTNYTVFFSTSLAQFSQQ